MATRSTLGTERNGRWTPSKDVWITEKRGISLARDPRTGHLKSSVNGHPPKRGMRA